MENKELRNSLKTILKNMLFIELEDGSMFYSNGHTDIELTFNYMSIEILVEIDEDYEEEQTFLYKDMK